jgi:hypothetical protein
LFSLELRSYYRPPEHNCLKPQLSNRNKSQIITTDVLGQVYNLQKLTLVAGLVPCSYPGLEPILRSSFGSLSLLKLNSSTWVNSPTSVATLFFSLLNNTFAQLLKLLGSASPSREVSKQAAFCVLTGTLAVFTGSTLSVLTGRSLCPHGQISLSSQAAYKFNPHFSTESAVPWSARTAITQHEHSD